MCDRMTKMLPPAELCKAPDSPVSGGTPAAVTDHSSYELGVIAGREQAAAVADRMGKEWDSEAEWPDDVRSVVAAELIAEAIRSGK